MVPVRHCLTCGYRSSGGRCQNIKSVAYAREVGAGVKCEHYDAPEVKK